MTIAIKNQTVGWPETVPVLNARDFCRWSYDDGHGHCCLRGRVYKEFPSTARTTVRIAILRVLKRRGYDGSIISFNDLDAKTLQEPADVWNEAMADELGYTEIVE